MCSIKSLDLINELTARVINEGRRMSRVKSVCMGMYQYGISVGLNLFLSEHAAALIHHLGNFSLTLKKHHFSKQLCISFYMLSLQSCV